MNKIIKKTLLITLALVTIFSCTNTELIEYWRSPEADSFHMSKVLVIGMTPNIEARKQFESRVKKELKQKGIEAVMSLEVLEPTYSIENKSQKQIQVMDDILTSNFFDAILFTKVKGVEDRLVYSRDYKSKEYLDVKFKEDYFNHQDIVNNPKYYEEYKVFHAETSLYCICPQKARELIWKGYIDIVDPVSVEETVDDYVNLLLLALEEQELLK